MSDFHAIGIVVMLLVFAFMWGSGILQVVLERFFPYLIDDIDYLLVAMAMVILSISWPISLPVILVFLLGRYVRTLIEGSHNSHKGKV